MAANLNVKRREKLGGGNNRRLRKTGQIPAVLYGHKREPMSLAVAQKDIWHILHTASSEHMILSLDVEGSDEGTILTLVRDIQHHPVTGDVLHLDLQRISADEKLHIGVPIELAGVAKGVKEEGGVLDHGIREVTLNVKPMEIPEKVSIDISHLEIVDDSHVTIAHVSAPKKLEVLIPEPGAPAAAAVAEEGEEGEGEEAAEGEEGEGEEKEKEKGKGKEKEKGKEKDTEKEKKGKS